MYRDDDEALFQRADALQREVDRLREELATERARYAPVVRPSDFTARFDGSEVAKVPPIPPAPFSKRKPPERVKPASAELLAHIADEIDHLGESPVVVSVDDVVAKVRALDDAALERVSAFIDQLLR